MARHSESVDACAMEITESVRKRELALFCGAGVSRNSGLPLARELAWSLLERLFGGENDGHAHTIMSSRLPFEALMEVISTHSDISYLLDIFSEGRPNINHILIARLARHGYLNTIVTTNFDTLIERALQVEFGDDNHFQVYCDETQFVRIGGGGSGDDTVKIFKIHGSAGNRESVRTTLKMVASRHLSEKRMNVVKHAFCSGNHKKILVLGYSCSDWFDIVPRKSVNILAQLFIDLSIFCHTIFPYILLMFLARVAGFNPIISNQF